MIVMLVMVLLVAADVAVPFNTTTVPALVFVTTILSFIIITEFQIALLVNEKAVVGTSKEMRATILSQILHINTFQDLTWSMISSLCLISS